MARSMRSTGPNRMKRRSLRMRKRCFFRGRLRKKRSAEAHSGSLRVISKSDKILSISRNSIFWIMRMACISISTHRILPWQAMKEHVTTQHMLPRICSTDLSYSLFLFMKKCRRIMECHFNLIAIHTYILYNAGTRNTFRIRNQNIK